MGGTTRTSLLHYGEAVGFTALAVLLRWLLDPWLGDDLPFPTLYGAVAFAVWLGGFRPALLAVVLGFLACDWLFVEPRGSLEFFSVRLLVGRFAYLLSCGIIIGFGETLHVVRRRADQQRESLKITLTSMGDAVITTDAEGRVTSLNPVAESLTGWTQDEAAGRPLHEIFRIINEHSRRPVENPVKKVVAEGRVVGLANHTTLIATDGTERPIDDSAAPIKDAQGLIQGVVLIFRDVTERRRSEQSARLLASIVESSDDAIIGKDLNGIITSWNQGAERIFGYTAAEAVGRPVAMLAPTDRADEMPGILERIRRGERVDHFDTVRQAKDGRLIPISLTVSPIKDEGSRIIGASKIARDVSARKRAEEALREEKARLHATLTGIGDAVIVTDAEGRVTLMNRVAQTLTGWMDEALGRPLEEVFRIINEETRQPVESPVSRVIREGTVVGLANHTTLIAQDDTERPIEDSAAPVRGYRGEIVGVVLVFRDASERRMAEASSQKYQAILKLVHRIGKIGHWEWNSLTDENKWSPEIEALYGLKPGTFEGTYDAWAKLLHPDDLPKQEEAVRRAFQMGHYFTEFRVVWPDGSVHWLEARANVFKDDHDKPVHFVGVNMDVTERKEAEARLRSHNERLRLLWEAASVLLTTDEPDVMLRELFNKIGPHFGLDTYFNYMVNEAGDALCLASYMGIPSDEAARITRLEFGQAICGTVALHRQPLVATHIQESDDPKTQLVKSFGIRAYACYPLHINGDVLGTLAFGSRSRDEFDEEELGFLQTICHYVAVRSERLRLLRRLRDADRHTDEFLAMLAHELRNPLAPIRNAVQFIQMKWPNEPGLQKAREIIDRQAQHMSRLMDDLLDVSRISRGKITLQKEQASLSPILTNAIEASRPLIEANRHELTVTLPPEPVNLEADTTRLAQVFLNLLNNAAKYTGPGGHIWLTAEREGSDVVVRVKDNGMGIPTDKLPMLFEMFSQIPGSLAQAQGGLGLGLHLVKRLVEMHGGSVAAYSDGLGKGSEFVVRLPIIVEASLASAPKREDESAVPKSSLRILIVDDNPDGVDTLCMVLRLMGNDICTAYDGEEAVAAAGEFHPDVILLDIGLPKLNGYEACRRIRQQPWGKSMILIAVTGWGQEEDRRRSHEAGFDKHMVKPVDPLALMKLLGELGGVKVS